MSQKALLLMGPPAVGKSEVCFEIFTQLVRAGIKSAYIDLVQVDFLRSSKFRLRESKQVGRLSNEAVRESNQQVRFPHLADEIAWQPDHEVREANLRAVWPGFQEAGAERLIVAGDVRDYSVPGITLAVCRLRASPEQLTERILARGRGEGAPIPGDDLRGRTHRQLLAFARRAATIAAQLDRDRPDDLCVDTDGRTITDIAAEVLSLVSLHH